MSMILYLRRATDADLAALHASPGSMASFFFETGAQESGDLIDFDKAWQAVHFLLSGAEYYPDDPLGAILSNGEPIGEDMGYGAGWIIPNKKMMQFQTALASLSDQALRERFDAQALVSNDIYGFEDCLEYPTEALNYLMQGVPDLRQFAKNCVDTNSSAIAAIC